METPPVACINLEQIEEGQISNFETVVSSEDIDAFAKLSGDVNPLHLNDEFAQRRGFKARVVHGAYLLGLLSRFVGVYLPGRDCLLLSMQIKYLAPTYANDRIQINGKVEQISEAAHAMTLAVEIVNLSSNSSVAKGKIMVGFTKEQAN